MHILSGLLGGFEMNSNGLGWMAAIGIVDKVEEVGY